MYLTKPERINSIDLCMPKRILDFYITSTPDEGPIYLNGNVKYDRSISNHGQGSTFRDKNNVTFGSDQSLPKTLPCTLCLKSMHGQTDMVNIRIDGLKLELESNELNCFIYDVNLPVGGRKDTYRSDHIDTIAPCNESVGCSSPKKQETDKRHSLFDDKNVVVKRKRGRPRKTKNSSCQLLETPTTKENGPHLPGFTEEKRYNLRGKKINKELLEAERSGSEEESIRDDRAEIVINETQDFHVNLGTINLGDKSMLTSKPPHDEIERSESTLDGFLENKTVGSKNKQSGVHITPPHVRRKRNNMRVVSCKICEKLFCDYTGVEDHVRKFHSSHKMFKDFIEELQTLKIVKCEQCDLSFKHRYALQLHEDKVHCKFADSSCNICQKKYTSLKSLKLHMKFVHNRTSKEHLCHLCPAKFKWRNTLKQHIQEIHLKQKNCVCKICEKAFSRQGQLNRHMRIHGVQGSKKFLCTLCGKGFWYDTNLYRHIKTVHDSRTEQFHCSYCGKGFAQKNSMISHVRLIHFKLYPFTCKICKSSFARSKLMEEHMRNVHGDTTYKASDSIRQRYKYNRSADDLFYCTYCSSSFFYKAKMVEHIHRAHSKDFPFVCDVCEQGFLLQTYLTKHQIAAHGHVPVNSQQETATDHLKNVDNSEIDHVSKLSDKFDGFVDVSISRDPDVVEYVSQGVTISDDFDLLEMDADAAAAASLLVQVASGNLGTHYVFKNSETADISDSMTGNIETEQPESVVEIITSDQGDTQIVLPNPGLGEDCDSTGCDNVIPEFVEDTVVLTDNLQFQDNIIGDIPLSVVIIESES